MHITDKYYQLYSASSVVVEDVKIKGMILLCMWYCYKSWVLPKSHIHRNLTKNYLIPEYLLTPVTLSKR